MAFISFFLLGIVYSKTVIARVINSNHLAKNAQFLSVIVDNYNNYLLFGYESVLKLIASFHIVCISSSTIFLYSNSSSRRHGLSSSAQWLRKWTVICETNICFQMRQVH